MIFERKHMEVNGAPSMLNTSKTNKGVASALQVGQKNEPTFDGQTIEGMRNNPLYDRIDKIDKIGLAEKKLAESANVISKSKFVRQANRKSNHPSKPN